MQAEVKPSIPAELADLRKQIDQIDAEIMAVLARRFAVTAKVGELKARHGLNSVDPVREQEKLLLLCKLAKEHGLNANFVQSLFQHVFNEVVKNHRSYLDK
jgi:chorismate mutase